MGAIVPIKEIAQGIEQRIPQIRSLIPEIAVRDLGGNRDLAAQQFKLQVVKAITENRALAGCTRMSLYSAIYTAAAYGFTPNTGMGLAYLIPYKNEATLQIGWRGLVALARREGVAKHIWADVVYENDKFSWSDRIDPATGRREKRYDFEPVRGDRGALEYAYAVATLPDGTAEFEVLDKKAIAKIRKASPGARAGGGPWEDWTEEMWVKSAVKRLVKKLAPTGTAGHALATDDAAMAGISAPSPVLDIALDEPPPAIAGSDEARLLTEEEKTRLEMLRKQAEELKRRAEGAAPVGTEGASAPGDRDLL